MFTIPQTLQLNQAAMRQRSTLFPKGKEDQPFERQVRGTVVEMYEDGKGLQPCRMLVQLDTGDNVLITCQDHIDAAQGDDIIARGVLHPAATHGLPPEMVVENGANPSNRLRQQIGDGATAHSFGSDTGNVNDRPGLAASIYGAKDIPQYFTNGGRPGVTVIKAATSSDEPTIAWVAKLFEGIPTRGNVNIVNPFAFLPKQPVGSLRLGFGGNPAQMIFGQAPETHSVARKLSDTLPMNMRKELPQQAAPGVLMSLPMYMRLIERGADHRKSDRGVLIPFNPWDSYTTLLGYTISMSPNMVSPKYIVPASVRYPHIAAHEMAHSVQDQYGVEMRMGSLSATNKAECFADSFAVIAGIQRAYGLASDADRDAALKGIEMIGQGRHGFLVKGGLTHATGHAYMAAYELGVNLAKQGKLQSMTTHDMLTEAGKLAEQHYFRDNTLQQIERIRQAAYRANGMTVMGRNVRDEEGGYASYKAIKAALAKGPAGFENDSRMFDLFTKAAAGVETVVYLPDELKQEATRNAAARLYEQDLEDTLDYARGTPAQRRILLELERLQHADEKETLSRRMHMMTGKGPMTGIDAKRREVIKSMAAKQSNPRKRVGEEVAITTIRRQPADAALRDAFSAHPQDRVSLYLTSLTAERDALNDAIAKQKGGAAADETAAAWKDVVAKAERRHLLAWAIQSAADGREFMDQLDNDDLKSMVAAEATSNAEAKPGVDAEALLKKLDDQIGTLQADPSIAPLIDPDPPMDIDDIFTRDEGPTFGIVATRFDTNFKVAHSHRPAAANQDRFTVPRVARRRPIAAPRL